MPGQSYRLSHGPDSGIGRQPGNAAQPAGVKKAGRPAAATFAGQRVAGPGRRQYAERIFRRHPGNGGDCTQLGQRQCWRARQAVDFAARRTLALLWAFFETLLNRIPLASLAAILIYTGYKLAAPSLFISLWRQGLVQFVPFLTTVAGIIFIGMLPGLLAGVLIQLLCSSVASHQSAIQLSRYNDHFVIRFNQNLIFLHNARLQQLLDRIPDNSVVIVEHESAAYLDRDIKATLAEFGQSAATRNIMLEQWPAMEK